MGPPKESVLRHSARLTAISFLPSAYFFISLSLGYCLNPCLFSGKRLHSYNILTYGFLSCLAGGFEETDRARNAEERRPGTNEAVTCTWIQWRDEGLSCPVTMDCARKTLWWRTTESFALCSDKQSCCYNKCRRSEDFPDAMLTVKFNITPVPLLLFLMKLLHIGALFRQNKEKQPRDKKAIHFCISPL